MMDWINALAAQDNSFESQLAQRDLTKKLALLESVQNTKVDNDQRAKEFDARMAETKASHDETARMREVAEADRKTTERRQQYNTVRDNLKPGDVKSATRDKDMIGLIQENEGAGQFEPDAANPDNLIYRKHQYEQEQLKLKQAEEIRAAAEKRAIEDQKRQEKEFALREKADKRAEDSAKRATQAFDAKQAAADKIASQLSAAGRSEAALAAKATLDATEKSGGFLGSDEKVAQKRAAIVHDAYDSVLKKEQARSGKTPPSTLIKGPESGEHRYWRVGGMVGPEPK